MSTIVKIILGILIGLILIGICVIAAYLLFLRPSEPAEPTAVATTAPPAGTEVVPGDAWDRVQAAGKIIVGTSADYPPFEYYVDNLKIDGFDIALMDEVGRRLGLEVEYHDFAFDGLGGALQLGQIDIAIAAISSTPEREAFVDFSSVYFVGQEATLAREDENISISQPSDLAGYTVGAQRGSVYDEWIHENLVATGLMPEEKLHVYQKADDAVRDLVEGRIELVVLDAQPAQFAVDSGGVKIVSKGFNSEQYAIALPKGESALKEQIDKQLYDLHNEGFIATLAERYLEVVELLPTPTPTVEPEVTSTPPPPPQCIDGMALVQVVEPRTGGPEDPAVIQPGQAFNQVWRVKNTGTCTWNTDYKVMYGSGNVPQASMGGKPTPIQGEVAPGQTYDISVRLVAPAKSGLYYGFWQLHNASGQGFGERLPFNVQVPAVATVTPVPTQTPAPGITFTVDRTQIKQGECVTFSWRVQNVREVYFYQEGEDPKKHGVVGEGSSKECPPATTTYYLSVVLLDGSTATQSIRIYVEPRTDAPTITRFTVDPPNQITLGQCVTVRWQVQGNISKVTLYANDTVFWDAAPVQGTYQDCPTAAGSINYRLVAQGPGGTSEANQRLNIVGEATATPVPTSAPDQPVIYTFSVTPEQVAMGGCFNINWSAGGGTTWVNVYKNDDTILENAPLSGSLQDCPIAAGPVEYGVEAYNVVDQSVIQDVIVQVNP